MPSKLFMVQAWYPGDTVPLPVEYFSSHKQALIYREWLEDLENKEQTPQDQRGLYEVMMIAVQKDAIEVIHQDERDAELMRQLEELETEDDDA